MTSKAKRWRRGEIHPTDPTHKFWGYHSSGKEMWVTATRFQQANDSLKLRSYQKLLEEMDKK